jgi:4-diphosphocytidyl-2-C-methyl-D-erythritol kinase
VSTGPARPILRERAPAKINVCLLLGPTRPADGRHELVSVMQAVDLADDVRGEPAPGARDEVLCPGVDGPNLAGAALAAFRERTGWDGPALRLRIGKRIPVAGGMAGGSADAAAALRIAAAAAGVADDDLLREIAAELGADVPAQVRPGRWLATGAGEHVRALPAPAPYGVLVLPGDAPLATPDVFREADRLGLGRDAGALAAGLAAVARSAGDLPDALAVNELEPAARSLRPSIGEALRLAREAGADVALVSGSGPTVLGLFRAFEEAGRAADELRRHRPAIACRPLTASTA